MSIAILTLAVLVVFCSRPKGDAAGIRALMIVSTTTVMIAVALFCRLTGRGLGLHQRSMTDASFG